MRIVVVGLRGFPNIQGGIETHCEELYPRITKYGEDVIVVRRKGFIKENPVKHSFNGVKFKDIDSPFITGFEAAIHTIKGVWFAKKVNADIVHIHAIGPSIAIPFAKILGLKIVMTHHGPDYERDKWGFFAKIILKMGEAFAAWWADDIISISTVISNILQKKYNRTKNVHLIYNGVTTFPKIKTTQFLKQLDIVPNKYILAVGRFVPEKRFDKLIEAYIKLNKSDYKLVIAGSSDYDSSYCCFLKEFALENSVILPGIVKGEKLYELYSNAALFVLPSSHEGLPITLLEAMSCKRKVLASDIPANKAVGLPKENYFKTYNLEDMISKINYLLDKKELYQEYDLSMYNWDNIAKQTEEIYLKHK